MKNGLKVISCSEQTARLLLAVFRENLNKLETLRFIKFLIYCILSFVSVFFSQKPQPRFTFLEFEADSDTNTLELRNAVLLTETNLNHINTKTLRVNLFVKKGNI